VLVEPDDALQLFESIHRALRACPDTLSAIYMAGIGLVIVGLGRQILRVAATVPINRTPASWSPR